MAPVAPCPVSLSNATSTFSLYTPDAGLCQPTHLITLPVPFGLTPLATIPWIVIIVLSGVGTGSLCVTCLLDHHKYQHVVMTNSIKCCYWTKVNYHKSSMVLINMADDRDEHIVTYCNVILVQFDSNFIN
jgi:hypothetical protein